MFQEGLLERHEFLVFFLDQVEKQEITDDTVLKLIVGQILRVSKEPVCEATYSKCSHVAQTHCRTDTEGKEPVCEATYSKFSHIQVTHSHIKAILPLIIRGTTFGICHY